MYILLDCFFFFKQKTAYEMRISDWSSDVCSSDLQGLLAEHGLPARQGAAGKAVGERPGALEGLALRGEQPDARRRDLPPFRAAPARCPGSSALSGLSLRLPRAGCDADPLAALRPPPRPFPAGASGHPPTLH